MVSSTPSIAQKQITTFHNPGVESKPEKVDCSTVRNVYLSDGDSAGRAATPIAKPSLLMGLPAELKSAIIRNVIENSDTRTRTFDLHAVRLACKGLNSVVKADGLIFSPYEISAKILGAINKMNLYVLLSHSDSPIFSLASLKKKKRCLDSVLGEDRMRIANRNELAKSVWVDDMTQLGRALPSLDSLQRKRVVDAAFDANEDSKPLACKIMGGWGAGFQHVTIEQQTRLISNLLSSANHFDVADNLHQLEKVLYAVENALASRLIDATIRMGPESAKSSAIRSLGTGLSILDGDQSASLINAVSTMSNVDWKIEAICGLGTKLPLFTDEQSNALLNTVLAVPDSNDKKAWAIRGLAMSLPMLKSEQHLMVLEALVDATLTIHGDVARNYALGSLIAGLQNPDSGRHSRCNDRIFEAALQLPDLEQAARVIGSFRVSLQVLSPKQRDRLFDAALTLPRPEDQNFAMCRLGQGLPVLSAQLKKVWLDHILAIPKDNEEDKALAIGWLGNGIKSFNEDQQGMVVDATLACTAYFSQSNAMSAVCFVEDPRHRSRLLKAVLRLDGDPHAYAIARLAEVYI